MFQDTHPETDSRSKMVLLPIRREEVVLPKVWRHADTSILNPEPHVNFRRVIVVSRFQIDAYVACRCELQGVANKIHDNATDGPGRRSDAPTRPCRQL